MDIDSRNTEQPKQKQKINQTVRMSAKSRSSICSHGKKTKVVSVVVYYDTSKASRDVTSTVRGTKRVNVKLKKGGQELIEHMKKIIAHSDLKGDYNRMDETGTLLTLYLLRCILYCQQFLWRLHGQPITHQICLKTLTNMIGLAINYHFS